MFHRPASLYCAAKHVTHDTPFWTGIFNFIPHRSLASLLVRVGSNITSTGSMTPSAVAGLFRDNNDKGCLYIYKEITAYLTAQTGKEELKAS